MSAEQAFRPIPNGTATLAATASTARVAITNAPQYRVWNAGATPVFLEFGNSSVVATLTGMPVPPGAIEVFRAPVASVTHVAGITASGTGSIYVTGGEGL